MTANYANNWIVSNYSIRNYELKKSFKHFILSIYKLLKFFIFFTNNNPFRKILFFYCLIMFVGAGLLLIPHFTLKETTNPLSGKNFSYIESLFTSASSLTNTGLSITYLSQQFTLFGLIVLLFMMMIGAIGFVGLKIFLLTLFLRKISPRQKMEIESEKSLPKSGKNIKMIRLVAFIVFGLIIFGSLTFTPFFYYRHTLNAAAGQTYHNFGASFFNSFFLTTTSISNTGFSAYNGANGTNGLSVFDKSASLLLYSAALSIIGSIGFPFVYEALRNSREIFFRRWEKIRLSFATKVIVGSYLIIFIIMFSVFLGIILSTRQVTSNFDALSTNYKTLNIFFFTVSSRASAGFSTFNVDQLPDSAKTFLIISMWIGSAPFSTGGGIRTTTIFVIFLDFANRFLRNNQVKIGRHAISKQQVHTAYLVSFISITLIMLVTVIFSLNFHRTLSSERNIGNFLIDSTSAFGTCGLTTGVTQGAAPYTLIGLGLLMIIGQLTISGTIFAFRDKPNVSSDNILHREEEVNIG